PREIESLLSDGPLDTSRLRDSLTRLIYAYAAGPEVPPPETPATIMESLAGKRFALVGFAEMEAERMCAALARVNALPRLLEARESPQSKSVNDCDAVFVHVRPDTMTTVWLAPRPPETPSIPMILLGDRDNLLGLDPSVQARASEFLMDAWQSEEVLMRSSVVLARVPPAKTAAAASGREYTKVDAKQPRIVLADDDGTVVSLVR